MQYRSTVTAATKRNAVDGTQYMQIIQATRTVKTNEIMNVDVGVCMIFIEATTAATLACSDGDNVVGSNGSDGKCSCNRKRFNI